MIRFLSNLILGLLFLHATTVQLDAQQDAKSSQGLPSSPVSGRRPNIVYILADDFGFGDLHALNPERGKIPTPNLDRLASQGMRFTDAHSGSSVCTPTRYGLLTGRYAWRSRLQRGVLDGTDDPPLIAAKQLTVGSFLKQQGYATAAFGKWHLGFDSVRPKSSDSTEVSSRKANKEKAGSGGLPVGSRIIDGPITRGFDYFWGCSNARTMSGLIENEKVVENIEPISMLPRLGQQVVGYIKEQSVLAKNAKPFFLYVPLTSPHTPILPTPEWQGKSGLGSYGDFVMQTDAVIGDILSALDQAGVSDNTLVIFTADNGCSPAARTQELEQQGHFASGPYRGYKADIWEGGHRVPFLVRWPGVTKPSSSSRQLICHVDLIATCAHILGVTLPDTAAVDSVSFLPALNGTDQAPLREAVVHHSIDGMFAIRQGKWKLEFCSGSGGWGSPKEAEARSSGLPTVQLYDLDSDITESKNLGSENPNVVDHLTQLLNKYIADGRSTAGPKQSNDVDVQAFKTGKRK
ncbi:MAG: arylsulfatase [Pirellula sp.]